APKFGDKDAWAQYIKQGYEDLVKNAIHGIGAMPPKGGNASLDDFDVARAVVHMADQAGANFHEPKEPAAGDAAQPQAAAAPAAPAPAAAAAPEPNAAQPAAQAESQPAQASASAGNTVGEELYQSVCITCHSI